MPDGYEEEEEDRGDLDGPEELEYEAPGRGWAVDEILALILLLATTIRIVLSVAAQVNFDSVTQGEPMAQRIGYLLIGADFGDGNGVLLLLFTMGLIWWGSTRRLENPALDPEEGVWRRVRARKLLTWLSILLVITAIGTLTIVVGEYLYHSGLDSEAAIQAQGGSHTFAHVFNVSGFEGAYLLAALGGLWATLRLRDDPEVDAFADDDTWTDVDDELDDVDEYGQR